MKIQRLVISLTVVNVLAILPGSSTLPDFNLGKKLSNYAFKKTTLASHMYSLGDDASCIELTGQGDIP